MYASIVKKQKEEQPEPVSEPKRITVFNEKPKLKFPEVPRKRGDCNYDSWEYAYFPYLIEMYNICYNYDMDMYSFFQFIYYVSSGEIAKNLRQLTEEEYILYLKYKIKREQQ